MPVRSCSSPVRRVLHRCLARHPVSVCCSPPRPTFLLAAPAPHPSLAAVLCTDATSTALNRTSLQSHLSPSPTPRRTMDFLKAAIANSKQKLAQPASLSAATSSTKRKAEEQADSTATASSAAAASSEPQPKKFKSRGEIEAERVAKLAREKEERIAARQAAAAGNSGYTAREQRTETAPTAAAATSGAAAAAPSASAAASAKSDSDAAAAAGLINANEVKRRLRHYSEPITLFGETDLARFQRLKLFELVQHEKASSSHGAQNTFAQILSQDVAREIKAAQMKEMEEMRKIEQEAAGAGAGAEGGAAAAASSSAAAAGDATAASASPDSADGVLLDETGKPLKSSQSKKDPAAAAASRSTLAPADMRRADFSTAEEFCIHFFKRMLNEWEAELDARPNEVRQSERGKIASAVQKQTHQFLKPLLKLLKTRTASADVLKACEKIVTACLDRRYNLADEAYLTMAIGNAAWPMGVTMVSIHERAGRTKIFSGQVAHVLNDDTQRKYIQSIKRLMTCKGPTQQRGRCGWNEEARAWTHESLPLCCCALRQFAESTIRRLTPSCSTENERPHCCRLHLRCLAPIVLSIIVSAIQATLKLTWNSLLRSSLTIDSPSLSAEMEHFPGAVCESSYVYNG